MPKCPRPSIWGFLLANLRQEYGQITRMLGNGRCDVQCVDGVKRFLWLKWKPNWGFKSCGLSVCRYRLLSMIEAGSTAIESVASGIVVMCGQCDTSSLFFHVPCLPFRHQPKPKLSHACLVMFVCQDKFWVIAFLNKQPSQPSFSCVDMFCPCRCTELKESFDFGVGLALV